jgi:cytochrome P450
MTIEDVAATQEEAIMGLFTLETAKEPFPAYRRVREQCPVARVSEGMSGNPTVYLSRYEDVMWAMRHPEVFSSSPEAVDIGQDQPLIPLQVDPPDHAKYRRLLDPEFSPKKMKELEAEARAVVNGLIDGFIDRKECDFHEEFATPLPSSIFLALMGLPRSDLPTFLRWRDETIRPEGDLEEAARTRDRVGTEITEYFKAGLAERRANPDDCMVLHLAREPERRRALVDDPSVVPAVVEELLRFETPVTMVPRVLKQDCELGGMQLHEGDHAVLLIGAGNADPNEFDEPESPDFAREANRHLAFGGGPHRCLGSHLARLELRVALVVLHRRIPDYRVANGADITMSPAIRQAYGLPLVWD